MPNTVNKTHIGAAPSWPPTQNAQSTTASRSGERPAARRAASFWRKKTKAKKAQRAPGAGAAAAPAVAAPPPSDHAPAPKIAQMLHRTDDGVSAPAVAAAAGGAAAVAKPAHQGGCGPWFRRNWIPLVLLLLGLLGLLLSLVFFLEPCPQVKVTTANPADVVVALDGSGSIAPDAYRQQLAAASHLLGSTGLGTTFQGAAAANYRAGVVQYSGCYFQGPAQEDVVCPAGVVPRPVLPPCYFQGTAQEEVVCPAGLDGAGLAQMRAARVEEPLAGDVGAVTALLDRSADTGNTAPPQIEQLGGYTWFGAALVNCATELEARGQGHGSGGDASARRGICTKAATATQKAASTTTTRAECAGDGREWHALGPPLGVCVLLSDGSNNDAEYTAARSFGVFPWCEAHGLGAAGACTAAGIADYLKTTLKFKIMGIFVSGSGDPAQEAAGRENMKRFSSCNAGATADSGGAAAVNTTGCSFYTQAADFNALEQSAKAIGASLGTEVGSSTYYMCTTDPIWFNFLLLFLPLLCYLLWRPATLLLAGFMIHRRRQKLEATRGKAVELAALEAGAAVPPPGPVPPPTAPGTGRRRKWTLVAADHYLWNLGGAGAAPMHVNFGEGAAPPSAPKQNANRRARRSVFAWEPPSAKDVYEPHEPQPGDLDYEYTRLWMNVLSCACCPLCCCGVPVDDPQTNAAHAAAAGGKAGGTGPRIVSGIGGAGTPQAAGTLAVRQPSLTVAPPTRTPSAPQV